MCDVIPETSAFHTLGEGASPKAQNPSAPLLKFNICWRGCWRGEEKKASRAGDVERRGNFSNYFQLLLQTWSFISPRAYTLWKNDFDSMSLWASQDEWVEGCGFVCELGHEEFQASLGSQSFEMKACNTSEDCKLSTVWKQNFRTNPRNTPTVALEECTEVRFLVLKLFMLKLTQDFWMTKLLQFPFLTLPNEPNNYGSYVNHVTKDSRFNQSQICSKHAVTDFKAWQFWYFYNDWRLLIDAQTPWHSNYIRKSPPHFSVNIFHLHYSWGPWGWCH